MAESRETYGVDCCFSEFCERDIWECDLCSNRMPNEECVIETGDADE